MKWREVTLGEGIHIKHGYAFKGEFFTDSGQYIVLTPGNFHEEGGFRLRTEKDRAYSGDIPDAFILAKNDLIVAMTEQGEGLLGSSAIIPESDKFLHNQRLGLLDYIDQEIFDKFFLYYLFNTRSVRHQISGSASGTKVRHTSPDRIYRVFVTVPDIKTQQKIADILSKYDDLIENNRRRIELLEESARLLYREWFIYLRFPAHEHTPIIDSIPEGWERKKIGDICETVGGGTPSTNNPEYWNDGNITWVVPTDVTRNKCLALLDSERKITEAGLKNSSAKLVPPDTILMTSRASVGFFALMDKEVCTNQGFICVIPYEENRKMYILYNLMYRVEEIRSHAGGSTYTEISKSRFRNLDILIPSDTLLQQFQEQTYQILQQIRLLNKQIVKLQQARDILLPRLMNGEIAV
jgi:type I restriction enzyme S subunit